MQKYLNIKALFFLGIFSMLLLHQTVPHWHHQHQDTHHHDVAHDHHDHHHHDTPETDSSKKGFIDWFLEMHMHTNATTTTDVLVLKQTTVKKITVEKETVKTTLTNNISFVVPESGITIKKWYQLPHRLQNTYLPNTPLRGPPSLG